MRGIKFLVFILLSEKKNSFKIAFLASKGYSISFLICQIRNTRNLTRVES